MSRSVFGRLHAMQWLPLSGTGSAQHVPRISPAAAGATTPCSCVRGPLNMDHEKTDQMQRWLIDASGTCTHRLLASPTKSDVCHPMLRTQVSPKSGCAAALLLPVVESSRASAAAGRRSRVSRTEMRDAAPREGFAAADGRSRSRTRAHTTWVDR